MNASDTSPTAAPVRALACGLLAATALLAACQRHDDGSPLALDTSQARARHDAEQKIPPTLVRDPSVPPASQVFAAEAASAPAASATASSAQDTRANHPAGSLTPEQERNEMPKSGQVNNHSSPAFEGGSPR